MSPMRGVSAREPVDSGAGGADGPVPILARVDLGPNVVPIRTWPDSTQPVSDVTELVPTALPSTAVPSTVTKPSPIFGTATVQLPEWPLVLVLAGVAISMFVVVYDSFRRGSLVLAAAVVLCFFLRLVLTDREAGMLKVRGRLFDLLVLGVLSAAMLLAAFWVPAPT